MPNKITVRIGHDGVLSAIPIDALCLGCGQEPEVVEYYTRTYKRDGEPVKVRVGYHCTCGAVVIDGMSEGHDPSTR